jgi:hypothetical protein
MFFNNKIKPLFFLANDGDNQNTCEAFPLSVGCLLMMDIIG